jgi:hypothetical protein
MSSPAISPLRVGQVLEIEFAAFTPRITFNSERKLTVEIVAGDNAGFSDSVEYEAIVVRDGLVILSWQEHIGSTIVHVLDFVSSRAYTAVTPAKGKFMRLTGRIKVDSAAEPSAGTNCRPACVYISDAGFCSRDSRHHRR